MTTQTESKRHLRALGAFQLALVAGSAILFSYAVHGSLEFNSMSLPGESHLQTRIVLPEGWKFFTRDPQSADALPWAQGVDASWHLKTPESYQGSALGLNRSVRAESIEFGLIASQIPESAYEPCSGSPASCLSTKTVLKTITNVSPEKTLCGRIGIVKQKPVPWAWARSGRPVVMPANVVIVEVKC